MSDGWSDYTRLVRGGGVIPRTWRIEAPIVPRRDDIRAINPPPPYFWLGKEAE